MNFYIPTADSHLKQHTITCIFLPIKVRTYTPHTHPPTHPDLSHNKLGDGAGRALGKLLNGHCPRLTVLDVSSNQIGSSGGVSIGHVLQNNTTLRELNLRMNRWVRLRVQSTLAPVCPL